MEERSSFVFSENPIDSIKPENSERQSEFRPPRRDGLTQGDQVRTMKLADRMLMRRYPDGRDGLSASGDGIDGAITPIGAASLTATAIIHATATPDPTYAHPPPNAEASNISPQVTCSAARSITNIHSTQPSTGSPGAPVREAGSLEGCQVATESLVGWERAVGCTRADGS